MFEFLTLCTRDITAVPENDSWLGSGECEVLAGLRFPKRRKDWRLGRWTAKQAILEFLRLKPDTDLSLFEIRAALDGAPEVFLRNKPAGAAISISHSDDCSFCAAGPPGAELGCDMERLEQRSELLISDYFAPEEIGTVMRMRKSAPENEVIITNLIWSAKESVLKALREGLRRDTLDVAIQPDFDKLENGWLHWTGRSRRPARVFRGRWRVDSRFVYTVTC